MCLLFGEAFFYVRESASVVRNGMRMERVGNTVHETRRHYAEIDAGYEAEISKGLGSPKSYSYFVLLSHVSQTRVQPFILSS